MTTSSRHIAITGASGFIGRRLARALVTDPRFAADRFTLNDVRLEGALQDARVRHIEGDLADGAVRDQLIGARADILIHLAGILGGAAEANPPLSRRVNIDATLDLFDRMRDDAAPPRLVFASSIAVFGPPLPAQIDDDTMPVATMIYGAQKRMLEIALEQYSARGWIDGVAIRLPGIVARRDADARLKSAFLNTMFYDYADGRSFELPVSADGTTWLISVPNCVQAFLHAATLPGEKLGQRRAFTLPAQRVRIGDLIQALGRRFPDSASKVTHAVDAALEAQFASQPALTTAIADALGFAHDGTLDRLVENAISEAI